MFIERRDRDEGKKGKDLANMERRARFHMDNVRVNVTGDKVTEGKHWFNGFDSWLD